MKKDFLTIHDLGPGEMEGMLELAAHLKAMQKSGAPHRYLEGKTLGMIFEKASTRTRVSFEVGMYQLGGYPLFLSSNDLQIGRGEPVQDTARVLSRYLDGIMIRTFEQKEVEDLAEYGNMPNVKQRPHYLYSVRNRIRAEHNPPNHNTEKCQHNAKHFREHNPAQFCKCPPTMIDNEQCAVQHSPDKKRKACAVPKAAECHADKQVQHFPRLPVAVSPKRNVQVITNPSAQCDMPSSPEFNRRCGLIG